MRPFLTSRRRMFDLLILLVLNVVFYFLWSSLDFNALFTLGFVWNWVASQDMSHFFEIKRYRFSTLRLVFNLQTLILKPFDKAPHWVKWGLNILPAGIFWFLVIYFNDSQMPWWATFLGSLTFELEQLQSKFVKASSID